MQALDTADSPTPTALACLPDQLEQQHLSTTVAEQMVGEMQDRGTENSPAEIERRVNVVQGEGVLPLQGDARIKSTRDKR